MPSAPSEPNDEPRPTKSWALGLGIAAFLLVGLFWAAVFTGKFNTPNPDKLQDAAWVAAAETTCKPAATAIAALPNASSVDTAAQRADLLDQGTDLLDPMVAELGSTVPTYDKDREVVTGWLKDWKIYLQDRRTFATALRKDSMAKPLLTETHGGWNTEAIDAMANANNIPSCKVPGDM